MLSLSTFTPSYVRILATSSYYFAGFLFLPLYYSLSFMLCTAILLFDAFCGVNYLPSCRRTSYNLLDGPLDHYGPVQMFFVNVASEFTFMIFHAPFMKLRGVLEEARRGQTTETAKLAALWEQLAYSQQSGRPVDLRATIFASLATEAELEADKLVR